MKLAEHSDVKPTDARALGPYLGPYGPCTLRCSDLTQRPTLHGPIFSASVLTIKRACSLAGYAVCFHIQAIPLSSHCPPPLGKDLVEIGYSRREVAGISWEQDRQTLCLLVLRGLPAL